MAINIGENENEQVTYVNSPDIRRVLFKNIQEGASKEDIVDAVNAWLDEHPEATTTVEDGSILPVKLNSTNSPSDGYVLAYNATASKFEWVDVQTDITELKNELEYFGEYVRVYSVTNGYYINTNVAVGNIVDTTPTSSSSYRYQILQVKKGEVYKITGTCTLGNNASVWAFTNSEYKLISKADKDITVTDLLIVAPNDGYLIANFKSSEAKDLYKRELAVESDIASVSGRVTTLETTLTDTNNGIEYFKKYENILSATTGVIFTNVEAGVVVDTSIVTSTSYRCKIVPVVKGETFKITGKASVNNYRLWAFTDSEYKLISKAENNADVTDLILTSPADGFLIVNLLWANTTKKLEKGYLSTDKSPLYGKKVAWYGDSIIKNNWWSAVSNFYGMVSTNCGVGGTKISGSDDASMCQTTRIEGQYDDVVDPITGETTIGGVAIPVDTEYIIVGGGTNDWAQNIALGEKNVQYTEQWEIIESVDTFYQACHVMFRRLAELRPNAKIIVLGTPFGKMVNRSGFTNKYGILNNQGLSSLDYGNALCDVAEMWGHYAIRYGNMLGINDENVETLLDPTTETGAYLHPTTNQAKKMFADATYRGFAYLIEL